MTHPDLNTPAQAGPHGHGGPPCEDCPSCLACPPQTAGGRLLTIDAMRGLVMLLMTLDHVRGQFSYAAYALWQDSSPLPLHPLDLDASTPLFFVMRWVTHLCAPTFIFLAGVAVHLRMQRRNALHPSRPLRPLLLPLARRGLMLVGFNMLLGLYGPFSSGRMLVLGVLWAIGIAVILLSLVVRLPRPVSWPLALLLVAVHDALHGFMPTGEVASVLWRLAFVRSYLDIPGVGGLNIIYPVLPWFGLLWLGYLCGGLADLDIRVRARVLPCLGLGFLAAFTLLRLAGGYGDPSTFAVQDTAWRTVAAFVNVAKYPPSLQFLLVTLGVMWFGLAWFDNRCHLPQGRSAGCPGWLVLPGRAPLFFYVVHLVVIRTLTPVLARMPSPVTEVAFSAGGIAFFTVVIFVALLPACAWVVRRHQKTRAQRLAGLAGETQAAHGVHEAGKGGGA